MMTLKNKFYLFIDPCDRCWKLTPVYNNNVMLPFIVMPISREKYEELLASVGV